MGRGVSHGQILQKLQTGRVTMSLIVLDLQRLMMKSGALRVTRGAAGEMVCAVTMMLGMSGYSKRRNAKMEAHNDL
jgi:hypothetical protein